MRHLFVLVLVLLTSCASILQSGPDPIRVHSEPPGATVFLDGREINKTPCTLWVQRKADGIVVLQKEDYELYSTQLRTQFNGSTILNVLWGIVGGTIGLCIDFFSGNMTSWTGSVNVTLKPIRPRT